MSGWDQMKRYQQERWERWDVEEEELNLDCEVEWIELCVIHGGKK